MTMGGMISTDVLSKLPIFSGLDERHLETLSRLSFVRAYERGECTFLEGEALPPCFHILMAGTLQIPFNIAAGGVLYCSFYPAYTSVFGINSSSTHLDNGNGAQA